MKHRATPEFWCEYRKLLPNLQRRANKQFSLLKSDPQHRSLQFKKIGERQGHEVWSARISLSFRALSIKREYGFLWFWIGDHETYEAIIA